MKCSYYLEDYIAKWKFLQSLHQNSETLRSISEKIIFLEELFVNRFSFKKDNFIKNKLSHLLNRKKAIFFCAK